MKERVEKHLEVIDKILYFSNFELKELIKKIKNWERHNPPRLYMCVKKLGGYENYEVQPGEELEEFIGKMLELFGSEMERINLEMIERKDRTYLLIAHYDTILGSRWINIFKKEEVEKVLSKVEEDNHEKN